MSSFHDVNFPLSIALDARGGPERRTDIVTLASGKEERNARWKHSRRRYEAGIGVRSLNDLRLVIAFFEERQGQLYAFRYKDPLDYTSAANSGTLTATDCVIGTGTGVLATFQLVKTYGAGATQYARPITKPIAATVKVSVSGVEQTHGTFYNCDAATGLITFTPSHVPPLNAVITAGFQFDVPVRFDTDALDISLRAFKAGDIPSIPLIEVLY